MKSIRTKIIWLLFSSVLIVSIIIGTLGILLTADVIQASSTENMTLLCRNNADKIDISLAKVEESINTLAHSAESSLPDIQSLKDDAFRETFSDTIRNNALHHVENVAGAVAIYLRYDPTYIGKTDGFFYAKYNNEDNFTYQPLADIPTDTAPSHKSIGWWYIPTVSDTATWFEAYYEKSLDRYVVSYVVPLHKDGQLVGVIGADIAASHIENLVKQISIFESGQGAVLNSDGTVMYHPNFDRGVLIGEGDPGFNGVIEKLTKEDSTKELISYQLKGEKKQLASCKLRNGMLLICFAPDAEIYHQQNMLMLANIVITVIVVLVALFIASWVSLRLVRPIKKLNEAAKHMTNGEFDFDIQSSTNDEIGELTETFIETRKILEHQFRLLDKEAHIDGLTGVGNKSAFMDREAELNKAIADGTADFSLVVFDVNKLKITNDVFGHMVGDRLLLTFANCLSSVFDITNVFRLGGDEFVVIIPEEAGVNSTNTIASCIASMHDLVLEGYPNCKVSCAYGASRLDKTQDHQLSDVLHRADKEMYRNKAESKKEIYPWQEGEKGIKQLQIDKYCELLQSLEKSTDDYLVLMNIETGYIRLFGGSVNDFTITDSGSPSNGIAGILQYVHPNDHALVREALTAVTNHDTETLDVTFRMKSIHNVAMRWVNCRASFIRDETDGHFLLIGRISQNAIKHLYNPVTMLFNKAKLNADLHAEDAKPFRYLMLIDVDKLSELNLQHGSAYGDRLLKTLAEALEHRFSMWQLYHAEKDRFVILLNSQSIQETEDVFMEIKEALNDECSISASVVPNDNSVYVNTDNIYDYAIQALSNAKKNGIGQLAIFSKEDLLQHLQSAELLGELEDSVKNGCAGFYLVYQPQIDAEGYSILAAEALLRFQSPTKGPVYPDQFIPLLEETGLIHEVGQWVAEQALRQCKVWRQYQPNFKVSVNVSPKQLEKKRTATQFLMLLAKYDLPGDALIAEITESSQLSTNENVFAVLTKLQQAGVQIAIDDFGTGYSNLGNLKHIHADILKVDRVFIRDIQENDYNYVLIYNVLGFARSNNLKVCLEGVENKEELRVLSGLQPDSFQGYLFDRPCPADTIEAKYFNQNADEYIQRTNHTEQLNKEKQHAPIVNMKMKTILSGLDIGLWIIHMNRKTGEGELYSDEVMRKLLGIDRAVTPKECYAHWQHGLPDSHRTTVEAMVNEMANTDKVVQVEYPWQHPTNGEIIVRCSGRCTEQSEDTLVFEGFHRIISDMGKSFG